MAEASQNPDPGQARRLRARAHRRGPGALRAQGPADRRPAAAAHRRGVRRPPLRRARREAVLRRAGRVHHRRAAGRRGARGAEAVAAARQLIGATNPLEAAPGSIRGDFALEVTFNLVHGSDSDESAEREIALWFPDLLKRFGREADPRLGCLRPRPAAARDPRRAGDPVRGRGPRRRGARRTERPEEVVLENARRKAAAGLGGGRDGGAGARRRHRGRARRAPARQGGRRGPRPASASRRSSGRTHAVLSGVVLLRRRAPGRGAGRALGRGSLRGDVPRARPRRPSRPTSPPASGATAPAPTRSRASGSILVERVEGDFSNVVGLPVRAAARAGARTARPSRRFGSGAGPDTNP